MKARVYELAKELKRTSKDLIKVLAELGIDVKNHMSTLTEDQVMRARAHLMPRVRPAAPPPPAPRPHRPPTTLAPRPTQPPPPPTVGRKIVPGGTTPPVRPGRTLPVRPAPPSRPSPPLRGPSRGAAGPVRPGRPGPGGRGGFDHGDGGGGTAAPPSEFQKPSRATRGPAGRGARVTAERDRRSRQEGGVQARPKIHRRELTATSVDLSSRASVEIHVPTTVREFSAETGIRVAVLLSKLMNMGLMANINSALNQETVELLALEFKFEDKLVIKAEEKAEDRLLAELDVKDREEDLTHRPAIITFLGHVDHGKTSLLDAIRGSNVQASEVGGITQHISAFKVRTKDGKQVVFLDTPGHEAFTKMRARGADVTDVVVLVVAADDGVMPQTEEAISHARAADVKIVVALNKIDLPGANPDRVKSELATKGLQPQDWGGTTEVVPCSAVTKQGIDDLLEILALESELLELKANPNRAAQGHVLEASVSGGKGVQTTLLVKNGTLRTGDYLIAGRAAGRVRAMLDDRGKKILEAPPSTPVEVLGLSAAPEAGDSFVVVTDEKQAREVAAERQQRRRGTLVAARAPASIEEIMKGISEKKLKEIRVVLKADVQGSVEVLKKELEELGTDEVKVNVVHAQVGGVNESDVLLASASGALVIGFSVIADERARAAAESHGVSLAFYNVIYKITEDLKAAMEGLLDPEEKEEVTGHVEIRKVFRISRVGNIAGCYVTSGLVKRNSRIRLARGGIVVHQGRLESLKREKNDAREVRAGLECGIKLEGYDDIKEGDTLEAYEIVKVKRTLGS
ncbi:MAG: translation initiation factor IF-2 [Planctomycetes bacterium]|nr:translation initiation factor IF-2 [Planctomycetota bacterium]